MSASISAQIFLGFLMFALVFVPLETWFPLRRKRTLRPGWATDVAYYAIGCVIGQISDAVSTGATLLIRHALIPKSYGVAAYQPSWLQLIEIVVVADFCAYMFHRLLHQFPFLWRFHEIHHTSKQMDWLANVRLHPFDKFLGDCMQCVPIFCIGFADGPMLTYLILLAFQGFLNHSNIKLHFGPFRWVVASPQFHHWHHSSDPRAHNRNFAAHLPIFDLIFGTLYLPPGRAIPAKYGVSDSVPEGLIGQVIYPFR